MGGCAGLVEEYPVLTNGFIDHPADSMVLIPRTGWMKKSGLRFRRNYAATLDSIVLHRRWNQFSPIRTGINFPHNHQYQSGNNIFASPALFVVD